MEFLAQKEIDPHYDPLKEPFLSIIIDISEL